MDSPHFATKRVLYKLITTAQIYPAYVNLIAHGPDGNSHVSTSLLERLFLPSLLSGLTHVGLTCLPSTLFIATSKM